MLTTTRRGFFAAVAAAMGVSSIGTLLAPHLVSLDLLHYSEFTMDLDQFKMLVLSPHIDQIAHSLDINKRSTRPRGSFAEYERRHQELTA